MSKSIRLALVLHNHQPIGNFDHVFEQAYQDSYRPFLEVFDRFAPLRIALHTSGSLMEWLDEHHPDYVDHLAELVSQGRIEIIGGAFYEPILAMLPARDRVGQIQRYSRWLEKRLGATVRGMWMAERVWEQSFARDVAAAGIEYTVLDDFHFKCAGLTEDDLHGYYATEDDGSVISIFPGSERLRYTIPFADPQETINHLHYVAEQHENSIVVFGDDGEKFGTWPETHKHCYQDRWLERFFEALVHNQDWLRVTTLAETVDHVAPLGKIYLPDCSYREMTEWVLPVEQHVEYDRLSHEVAQDARWDAMRRFVRGGIWRNFKVRYPEADEMYSRMMQVSRRLDEASQSGCDDRHLEAARAELYRGQCNCSYWHGAFGGIYLPHLRNAVYQKLIRAENLLDQAAGRTQPWVEAKAEDLNFDARQEVQLANDKLIAWINPVRGGQIYELDIRSICHNLLATLTRRPEAYHRKVLAGNNHSNQNCASIHDRVICKQEGLDQRIQYDSYLRKSLVDLFYENHTTLETVVSGQASQHGDFVDGAYEAILRRNPDRIQVKLVRDGMAFGMPIRITKGITLSAGSSTLEVAYLLEGLRNENPLHFAVEMNFAGMPGGADDRYFYDANGTRLGQLGHRLDLNDTQGLGLVDEWLGLDVSLKTSLPTNFWAFPVETVSQSEGGFELVHQSVAVQPHWFVVPDSEGRWSVTMQIGIDTTRAESRFEAASAVAVL